MIRPGEEWGIPATSPPDLEVEGGDPALAAAVSAAPGALVRFRPDATSDLARSVGLAPSLPLDAPRTEVPLDVLAFGDGTLACNMCVLGTPPDRLAWRSPAVGLEISLDGHPWFSGRATTVVIATGQFLRGLDVVPRGHPGDGKAEVQVYELERRERRAMRARLAGGAHVPHPRIRSRTARQVEIHVPRPLAFEVDGVGRPPLSELRAEVVTEAYRLLV